MRGAPGPPRSGGPPHGAPVGFGRALLLGGLFCLAYLGLGLYHRYQARAARADVRRAVADEYRRGLRAEWEATIRGWRQDLARDLEWARTAPASPLRLRGTLAPASSAPALGRLPPAWRPVKVGPGVDPAAAVPLLEEGLGALAEACGDAPAPAAEVVLGRLALGALYLGSVGPEGRPHGVGIRVDEDGEQVLAGGFAAGAPHGCVALRVRRALPAEEAAPGAPRRPGRVEAGLDGPWDEGVPGAVRVRSEEFSYQGSWDSAARPWGEGTWTVLGADAARLAAARARREAGERPSPGARELCVREFRGTFVAGRPRQLVERCGETRRNVDRWPTRPVPADVDTATVEADPARHPLVQAAGFARGEFWGRLLRHLEALALGQYVYRHVTFEP